MIPYLLKLSICNLVFGFGILGIKEGGIMKISKFIYLSMVLMVPVLGQIGCMDNSKHTDISDGYDYKTLHYVQCNCPCHKYRHLHRKGKCFKCRHYVKLDDVAQNIPLRTASRNPFISQVYPYLLY